MGNLFGQLQRVGKALMLPIAILPAAALLLRLGAPDVFDIPFIMEAGGALFANLALLFAIGVAVGISFDGGGAAGLAGIVGYLVMTKGISAINPDVNMGVLAGIITGLLAGAMYNRFHDIRLPDYLGFFGGKRFVPIVTAGASIVLAGFFGYAWVPVQSVIYALGEWIIGAGALGVGVFGFANRLLIPLGLHHVINSMVWFVFGEFTDVAGNVVAGDLSRFFAGDPAAGIFMTGFFPIFMFGLPAAALAMYHTAKPENKKAVAGIFVSVALTTFLTGITEPIEFSFLFLAPLLFLIHALLTGASLGLTYVLGIRHGFGFSAGAIDYFLNFGLATGPLLIIPLGVLAFALYYSIFRFAITKFDLPTPGRLEGEGDTPAMDIMPESQRKPRGREDDETIQRYIDSLGGADNLKSVEACITRLRIVVNDADEIDEDALKRLGATGVLRATKRDIQVVVGTKANIIADKIKKELKAMKNRKGR